MVTETEAGLARLSPMTTSATESRPEENVHRLTTPRPHIILEVQESLGAIVDVTLVTPTEQTETLETGTDSQKVRKESPNRIGQINLI